jgi:outer membrane protein OmpA-like peptidoglycan-associated protein
MDTLKKRSTNPSPLAFFVTWILLTIISMLLSFALKAQDYQKSKRKSHHSYYRKQTTVYAHACNLLAKNRNRKPKKVRNYVPAKNSVLSIDPNMITAQAGKPKPASKPTESPAPFKPKIENITPEQLEELHKREDAVLEKNHLPKPTSAKQKEVRDMVADRLENKKDIFPLQLAPLYFTFDEDEFSIVDMEPFLVAAEYALQGRTVLIEGHTDSHGMDTYNVKLSIKRVQKIRQLMRDMGVPDDRISVVGYGEELNTNDNKTEEGRQLNRRVDFTVY